MLGVLCGLAVVLVIGIVLRIINKSNKTCEYDERQEAIRGTGFKYAYFTALIVLCIGGIIEMLLDKAWCGLFTFAFLAVWASVCVFTTYCVIKDAYFTLRSRRKALIAIFIAAGVINLGIGIGHIIRGDIIEGGMLSLNAANLITGAGCLYLGVMIVCRSLYERRMEDAE
jgi:hypothetical protein